MCDINTETKLKTQIIYKVVKVYGTEKNPKYRGYFSEFPIKLGRINRGAALIHTNRNYKDTYGYHLTHYNVNIIGRCSGFEDLEAAKKLYKEFIWPGGDEVAILKIKIAAAAKMPIMRGTGCGVCDTKIIETAAVFAGPVIESFEVVPPRVPLK